VRDEVIAADRDLFRDTIKEHLTDEIYTIHQWVLSHKSTVQQSRRESRRCSRTKIKLLPAYFHPLKKGKRKRTHFRSAPTPVPLYQSTRMGDHFQQVPSTPPLFRAATSNSLTWSAKFNNFLSSLAATIPPGPPLLSVLPELTSQLSRWVCFQPSAEMR
jgi:hypothetical protein